MLKKFMMVAAFALLASFVLAGTAAKETPLPAGGGDPGKAYMEYCKAVDAADFDAMKKMVTADQLKSIDDPGFRKMFPIMQALKAKNIKVTGGTTTATEARLHAEGVDSQGKSAKGKVTMALDGKQWKVKDDDWSADVK